MKELNLKLQVLEKNGGIVYRIGGEDDFAGLWSIWGFAKDNILKALKSFQEEMKRSLGNNTIL